MEKAILFNIRLESCEGLIDYKNDEGTLFVFTPSRNFDGLEENKEYDNTILDNIFNPHQWAIVSTIKGTRILKMFVMKTSENKFINR